MPVSPKKLQILIANAAEAKRYETSCLGEKMTLIKEYQHPESRAKRIDLLSDRPGRYFSRDCRDSARGAYANTSDPKEVEADNFARELADDLNHLAEDQGQFLLILPAHFFGLMNKHLNDASHKRVFYHLEKDYTKIPQKQLLDYLAELRKELNTLK